MIVSSNKNTLAVAICKKKLFLILETQISYSIQNYYKYVIVVFKWLEKLFEN